MAFAMALYSAYVLDRDTVAWFGALQDMRLLSRKTAKPSVEQRSSRHPAQSASEKTLTNIDFDRPIFKPKHMAPLTYPMILFTAAQCTVVGE